MDPVRSILLLLCAAIARSQPFLPAYVQQGQPATLTVFQPTGPPKIVQLPADVPTTFSIWMFSRDGRSIYGESPLKGNQEIFKIELNPPHVVRIRFSIQLEGVRRVTESQDPNILFVSGFARLDGVHTCGAAFQLAMNTGAVTLMRAYPCGTTVESVSPDGRFVLLTKGKHVSLSNLRTGNIEELRGIESGNWSSWSPDSRWISVIQDEHITLIEAEHPKNRRSMRAVKGPVTWSPDSKAILYYKSQLSCALTLYFGSLEVMNLETKRRNVVNGSHCEIGRPQVGWVSPSVIGLP